MVVSTFLVDENWLLSLLKTACLRLFGDMLVFWCDDASSYCLSGREFVLKLDPESFKLGFARIV